MTDKELRKLKRIELLELLVEQAEEMEKLREQRAFTRLRGMIYFTDGYGRFPAKKPPYETAFVVMKEDYHDADVPAWAMKLILEKPEK